MNLIQGTIFKAELPVFEGSWRNPKFSHNVLVKAVVTKENYGSDFTHRFTFEVLESDDSNFVVGKKYRKNGDNLYPNIIEIISQPENYDELAEEKSLRKEENSSRFNNFNEIYRNT